MSGTSLTSRPPAQMLTRGPGCGRVLVAVRHAEHLLPQRTSFGRPAQPIEGGRELERRAVVRRIECEHTAKDGGRPRRVTAGEMIESFRHQAGLHVGPL